MTENEKRVLYGLIKYPLFNDIELSEKLKIKRSTVTAIKNKLKRDNFCSAYRIPKFSLFDCELITLIYSKLNPATQHKVRKFSMFREAAAVPEQIYMMATNSNLLGICISRNFTEVKKHLDTLIRKYKEFNLMENINLVYFPYEVSCYEKLFEHDSFLSNIVQFSIKEEQINENFVEQVKKELTEQEKIILHAVVKFSDLNDSEIAEIIKLPRISISQTRRKLIEAGFLRINNIPNPLKLGCELLVLNHIKFNPKVSINAFKKTIEYMKNSKHYIFIITNDIESCCIGIYSNYTEFEIENNKNIKFYKGNNLITENPNVVIIPLRQIQFQKLDFAPLLKKIFDINVDY